MLLNNKCYTAYCIRAHGRSVCKGLYSIVKNQFLYGEKQRDFYFQNQTTALYYVWMTYWFHMVGVYDLLSPAHNNSDFFRRDCNGTADHILKICSEKHSGVDG